MNPLVIAYHMIWTGYGHWLPNDPRGSHSQASHSDVLKELGDLHLGRKKVQPDATTIRAFYDNACDKLKHEPLHFGKDDRALIATAFAEVITECKFTCYACAIMPDHAHILIRKHKHPVEETARRLHEESRTILQRVYPGHPVWTSGCGWKVFLEHPEEVWRTIHYTDDNPIKIGLAKQDWPFVTKPYNNWPLHLGHNPNSPWARRLCVR